MPSLILMGSDSAVPVSSIRFSVLSPIPLAGPASSVVSVTPVRPSLMAFSNFSFASLFRNSGATMSSRPPGTYRAVFESVLPSSAPTTSIAPVVSLIMKPPCSVIVLLIGTVRLPTVNSPLVVSANRQKLSAGLLRGQSANCANSPFGWCSVASAGDAAPRAASGAITASITTSVRLRTPVSRVRQ